MLINFSIGCFYLKFLRVWELFSKSSHKKLFKYQRTLENTGGFELIFIHPKRTVISPGVRTLIEVDTGGMVDLSEAVLSCAV